MCGLGTSGRTFQAVVQLRHGQLAILQCPGLIADLLDEVDLRLDHQDASSEAVQGLCEGFNRLDVQVVRGLVHCDEVRLGPEHCRERQPHLLAGREASDLLVAAHLLINAESLAVLGDLSSCQRPLVESCSLRCDALVTGDHNLVQAHVSQGLQRHHGVLLRVIKALPLHLVVELAALLASAQQLADLIAVLAVLLRQGCTARRLLVVLGLDEALLELLVIAVLETLGDVGQRRCVKVRTEGLQVVLLHVSHAQVAVTGHVTELAILALRCIHLRADQRHQGRLSAAVSAADGDAGAQGQLARHVLNEVVLVLAIAEGEVLELNHSLRAGFDTLHRARDREADLWRTSNGRLDGRLLLLGAFLALLILVELQVA
mmetsp:Transcript_9755/g.18112  ORF Transcript_9755/g.18112 Transcript_9755/m.18112 type:complete len:374 (+) Transcript_9755:156-1277(+)